MRHGYGGKKLSRSTDERKQLIRNLARELIAHGSIKTTRAKAHATRSMVEKLITKAKRGTSADTNSIRSALGDKTAEQTLFADAKERFAVRTSGFTRIVKLGIRRGDATEEVLLSFVDARVEKKEAPKAKEAKKEAPKTEKKPVKRKTKKA